MSGVSKLTADRHQRILLDLVNKPGNDVCADCKARAPRWASYNLGIFLCMNCASIHRKIGTHITKVKSVTMDSWSKDQVEVMKSIGNVASNAKFNPNEARNPPPTNREESERDSELEKFIRWKYEFKRFMEKPASSVKAPSTLTRSTPTASVPRRQSPTAPAPLAHIPHQPTSSAVPAGQVRTAPAPSNPPSIHPIWNDIMSLAEPRASSAPQFHQPSFASEKPYATPSLTNTFPSTLVNQRSSRTAALPVPTSVPASFQAQMPQSSMVNPFVIPQQSTAFSSQVTGTPFQTTPIQGQSQVSHSSFARPPFLQSSQTSSSHSYTPSSSFSQQQQPQQQQYVQALPQMQMQMEPQSMQGGNPFVAPTYFPQQMAIPGQQQVWLPEQQAGFASQQQYGQWDNV